MTSRRHITNGKSQHHNCQFDDCMAQTSKNNHLVEVLLALMTVLGPNEDISHLQTRIQSQQFHDFNLIRTGIYQKHVKAHS